MDLSKASSIALANYAIQRLNEGASREELKSLKEEMLRRGFNAPFKHILASVFKELDKEEAKDVVKHMKYFRQIAILKKLALRMTNVALASIKMKEYLEREGYHDLIPHLPFNGDYVKSIIKTGYLGAMLYKDMMNVLSSFGEKIEMYEFNIKELSFEYKVKAKNEEEVKKRFGDVEITGRVKKPRIVPIIRSPSVRRALISAIISYSFDALKHLLYPKELDKYNAILHKHGIEPLTRLDFLEGFEEAKKELAEKGFMDERDGIYITKKEIAKKIEGARLKFRKKFIKAGHLMLFVPIIKHYLTKSFNERRKLGLYPTLSVKPTELQLAFLKYADVGFNAFAVVKEKLKMEERANSKLISAGLLAEERDKEFVSKFLNISKEDVEKGVRLVKGLRGGRGDEFLKGTGNKKKK